MYVVADKFCWVSINSLYFYDVIVPPGLQIACHLAFLCCTILRQAEMVFNSDI